MFSLFTEKVQITKQVPTNWRDGQVGQSLEQRFLRIKLKHILYLQLCECVTKQAEWRHQGPPLLTSQMRKFTAELVAASFYSFRRQWMNKWKKGRCSYTSWKDDSDHREKLSLLFICWDIVWEPMQNSWELVLARQAGCKIFSLGTMVM